DGQPVPGELGAGRVVLGNRERRARRRGVDRACRNTDRQAGGNRLYLSVRAVADDDPLCRRHRLDPGEAGRTAVTAHAEDVQSWLLQPPGDESSHRPRTPRGNARTARPVATENDAASGVEEGEARAERARALDHDRFGGDGELATEARDARPAAAVETPRP